MSQPINCASKYQPFPCFYVYRPGYLVVPLIPLDELPWWIQVGDFNWTDSALYESMLPASFNYFPRVGEYDVVCHHCYAHVDSLHRSVSERSNSNASSHTSNVPKGLGAVAPSKPAVLDHPYMLKHPPFEASFNTSPFVGMCFVKCPSLPWSIRSRRAREDDQNVNQDGHPGDHGSNNGSSHSMQVQGESSNNGSSHSMQTQEEQTTNGSDSVVVEYRPIVHEENSDATVPPVEEPMHFSISIDDNSHTPVEDNLIPDPRHSDTELRIHAMRKA
ncbi:hypothetical protein BO78DRAFT_422883 [Aspergillus sclerotiicarbonarius CBS 121057]|uniref:Uncharacterized protein n=1 Tax=Aspergillus sclerotiicarbonarius (strain CBS 121057 / IBT 28362) TaxID=1448318 RepID=A0A319DW98_ASPSB|nr:hypothetical protein BO78DRAFT_422883 [Aspergillus sclerotiicarbonarius CBS 121057]